jgi:tetratricopeptide (TPR) repeat protein
MKIASALFLIAGSILMGNAHAQQSTPAEQRIAAARQQIAADPKKPEAYNNLALAFLSRAQETASSDYDRQAAEAIATGLKLVPQDFQLRKAHVALLLDQHEFARARDEAKDLHLHNPDDATVHGYLARAYIGLGNYQEAESSAQWMLNLQPFNVPGLLIAAGLRQHYGDPEGALEFLNRAYQETSPGETGELASIANRMASIEIGTGRAWMSANMQPRLLLISYH